MILINSGNLAKAKESAKEQLEQLANDLMPASSQHHDPRKQEFMVAVEEDDDKRVNTMLNEALENYLDNGDILAGLTDFCQRMGAPSDIAESGEDGLLQWIADHSADISRKLDEEAKNATK